MRAKQPSVLVVGAGKVGTALASALGAAGSEVELVGARSPRPSKRRVDVCLVATRDAEIGRVASEVASHLAARTPLLHTAGALGTEALSSLRGEGFPVGQMHPLLSFVSGSTPSFHGAWALVSGDEAAVAAARRVATTLGLSVRVDAQLSRALYHAAAALAANGTAALIEGAVRVLVAAGLSERDASSMLSPLVASVARNVAEVGARAALSGPVRRGDARTVAAHVAALAADSSAVLPLYRASATAQLDVARALDEMPATLLDEVEAALRTHPEKLPAATVNKLPPRRGLKNPPRPSETLKKKSKP